MWIKIVYIFVSAILIYNIKNHVKIISYLNYQFKFCFYYFSIAIVSLIILPILAVRPKNLTNGLIFAEGVKHVTKVIGIKWHLRNENILAEDRGAVIVANHQSSLDILGKCNVWNVFKKGTVVAKKEALYIFPLGLVTYLIGAIFINRKRPQEAYKELYTKADHILKNKSKLWIYPEGTRNNDPTKMLPFKKGAFSTAVASQVPIIPVVFSPYYFINRTQHVFDKGHIIIQCLEPVSTNGLTMDDVPDLIERVRNMMICAYKESVKEIKSTFCPNYPIQI